MKCGSLCTRGAEDDWKPVNLYVFMSVSRYFSSFFKALAFFINSLYSSYPSKNKQKKSAQHLIALAEKGVNTFQSVRHPLSLAWQRLSIMDLQNFGCSGISMALMVPAHCFLPMSSSLTKETGAPVRLSGLTLHFCKFHCLLSLLTLYLLWKYSHQLTLLIVGWRCCFFFFLSMMEVYLKQMVRSLKITGYWKKGGAWGKRKYQTLLLPPPPHMPFKTHRNLCHNLKLPVSDSKEALCGALFLKIWRLDFNGSQIAYIGSFPYNLIFYKVQGLCKAINITKVGSVIPSPSLLISFTR